MTSALRNFDCDLDGVPPTPVMRLEIVPPTTTTDPEPTAPFFVEGDVTIYHADAREVWRWLPERSVHAIVTSPPYYGLRDYGVTGQIGLEGSPAEYVDGLADLLTGYGERVLREDGSLWLNLGDTYSAYNRGESRSISGGGRHVGLSDRPGLHGDHPAKCLLMIPERVALALIERGWILRNKVVWAKSNGMPSSAKDRLATKWEALYHFTRKPRYYYDLDAIREPQASVSVARAQRGDWSDKEGRVRAHFGDPPGGLARQGDRDTSIGKNPGDVWFIATQPFKEAHFAVFPAELIRRPILATVPPPGVVIDPFMGAGTTLLTARALGRRSVGIELSDDYCQMTVERLAKPFALRPRLAVPRLEGDCSCEAMR